MLNVILLGDPAAGKATQAAKLSKKYNLYDLDMGRELRIIQRKRNDLIAKQLRATIDKGRLAPTKIVREILKNSIFAVPAKKGIIFDGTPKMVGEAKLVSKWLKLAKRNEVIVLYLSVPHREILKRMAARQEYFRGKFSKRPDDNEQALKNRIEYYHHNIAEVIDYFSKKYAYKKINGVGSVHEVNKRLLKEIDAFLYKKT